MHEDPQEPSFGPRLFDKPHPRRAHCYLTPSTTCLGTTARLARVEGHAVHLTRGPRIVWRPTTARGVAGVHELVDGPRRHKGVRVTEEGGATTVGAVRRRRLGRPRSPRWLPPSRAVWRTTLVRDGEDPTGRSRRRRRRRRSHTGLMRGGVSGLDPRGQIGSAPSVCRDLRVVAHGGGGAYLSRGSRAGRRRASARCGCDTYNNDVDCDRWDPRRPVRGWSATRLWTAVATSGSADAPVDGDVQLRPSWRHPLPSRARPCAFAGRRRARGHLRPRAPPSAAVDARTWCEIDGVALHASQSSCSSQTRC